MPELDLVEVKDHGKISRWYDLSNNGNITGQILLEIVYSAGEYPSDKILYPEATKLSHDPHHSKSIEKIPEVQDTIPEEPEEK